MIFKSVATHVDSPVNLRETKVKTMKSFCKGNHLSVVLADRI